MASIAMAAPSCSLKEKAPKTARNFAKAGDQDAWRQYKSAGEVPQLNFDSGISAQFWQDKNKSQSVYMVQPGQDFTIYTRYCFSGAGALENVDFEVRTPLGWGHRVEGVVSGNGFNAKTAGFFSMKNDKAIPKPDGVGDAPAALKPAIYLKIADLPFASQLPVPAQPDHKGKKKKAAPASSAAIKAAGTNPAGADAAVGPATTGSGLAPSNSTSPNTAAPNRVVPDTAGSNTLPSNSATPNTTAPSTTAAPNTVVSAPDTPAANKVAPDTAAANNTAAK